jgi:hypothetical protein
MDDSLWAAGAFASVEDALSGVQVEPHLKRAAVEAIEDPGRRAQALALAGLAVPPSPTLLSPRLL